MDYTINVKSSGVSGGGSRGSKAGVGTDVSSVRKRVIEAQKNAEKINGSKPSTQNQQLSNLKPLVTSINKLIDSNKALISALNKNASRPSNPMGGGGGGGGGKSESMFAGAGALGASLPFAGVAIAASGFMMHKISQIGEAYMQKMSEQKRSAGTGGIRYGEGMYTGSEIGAGMGAYAKTSGKFATDAAVSRDAVKMGGLYGLGADEVLGQAGTMARAGGGSMGGAISTIMGGGVETQLPMIMSAMAGSLEEAITNGLDASSLAKDLPAEITALAMSTRGKDAGSAIAMSKSMSGVKAASGKGHISSTDEMFAYKAAAEKSLSNFGDTAWLKYQVKSGTMTQGEADKYMAMTRNGKSVTSADVINTSGEGMDTYYAKLQARTQSEPTTLASVAGHYLSLAGGDVRKASQLADQMGSNVTPEAMLASSKMGKNKAGIDAVAGGKKFDTDVDAVEGGAVGRMTTMSNQRDTLTMGTEAFANAANAMENQLMSMAKGALPTLSAAMQDLADLINGIGVDKPKTAKGKVTQASTDAIITGGAQSSGGASLAPSSNGQSFITAGYDAAKSYFGGKK